MRLPSEHFYIRREEAELLLPGVKKMTARLADAKQNHFPFMYPWDRILATGKPTLYRNQRFDQELACEFQKLQNRLTRLNGYGHLRLNVVHVSILAFALRVSNNREHPVYFELARKLENLRKRLKRATIRKHGAEAYRSIAERWRAFIGWMHYWLLFEKCPRDPAWQPVKRSTQAWYRAQVKSWVDRLIRDRCEEQLSPEELDKLAKIVKRHARRGRFKGIELRVMLQDTKKYDDLVFSYVFTRAQQLLGRELVHPMTRKSMIAERIYKALRVDGDSPAQLTIAKPPSNAQADPPPIVSDKPTPPPPNPVQVSTGVKPDPATNSTQTPVKQEHLWPCDRQELIDGTRMILQRFACIDPQLTISETKNRSKSYKASKPPEKRQSFTQLVQDAELPVRPLYEFLIDYIEDDGPLWEVNWLLEKLSWFIPVSQIPSVMDAAAVPSAQAA